MGDQYELTTNGEESVEINVSLSNELLKKGYVLKNVSVEEDTLNGNFGTKIVPSKRRSKKAKKLKHEEFSYNVYPRNQQSGFVTDNLTKWALAIEKYVEKTERMLCRWLNKVDSNSNRITECKLILYFNTDDNL